MKVSAIIGIKLFRLSSSTNEVVNGHDARTRIQRMSDFEMNATSREASHQYTPSLCRTFTKYHLDGTKIVNSSERELVLVLLQNSCTSGSCYELCPVERVISESKIFALSRSVPLNDASACTSYERNSRSSE